MAVALTTHDNPYSPFSQWEQWMSYDEDAGHNTLQKIGRLAGNTIDQDEEEIQDYLTLQAYLFIIEHDLTGLYYVVQGPDSDMA